MDRLALEERIFGAIRDVVLTPENVNYVVGLALDALRAERGEDTQERNRRRLAQIEVETERAVELGVRTGGLDAVTRKLAAIQAEAAEIRVRLDRAPAPLSDLAELRPLIEARVADFRRAFEAEPDTMRQALRALLGEERIAVREDAERGFVAEGWLSLPLGIPSPGIAQDPGRWERVVAGVRFSTGERFDLPCAA